MYFLTNIVGCTSVPLKKSPEIWLIDGETDVLYRRKNDETEYAIPIKGNHNTVKEFMCVPSKEIDDMIEVKIGPTN